MPKLSDIGSKIAIEDLFAYFVKHKADELGVANDEVDAVIELFRNGFWKNDEMIDKQSLFKEVCLKYDIQPKRMAESFIAVLSSFNGKLKQGKKRV